MTKKHFIWAANFIANDFKNLVRDRYSPTSFKEIKAYKCYVDLFTEFNPNFDIKTFNEYIEKQIKKG